ncbi:ATP-binding protein [Vibrio mediterranei]|uniref:ATP-binding protein n=1 Tax=Vibrio mediterranei TaxID=689 RepID=UPI001E648A71|nr:ATP-binding protein [Vibrio mediterranei]
MQKSVDSSSITSFCLIALLGYLLGYLLDGYFLTTNCKFSDNEFNQSNCIQFLSQNVSTSNYSSRESISILLHIIFVLIISTLSLIGLYKLVIVRNGEEVWTEDAISQLPSLIFLESNKGLEKCNCNHYESCLKSGGCVVYQQFSGQEESVLSLNNVQYQGRCKFDYIKKIRVTKRLIPSSQKMLSIVDDITADYQQRSVLKKAHKLAVEEMESREFFLATMSHELRTPIASMIGLLELLSYENRNIADDYKLKSLMSSAKNLQLLVNDILDYSKLDSQGISLVEEFFSYTDLLGDLVRLHEASARERGLVFETQWDSSEIEFILTDALRLSQIVNNVLSNAVKFTEQGKIKVTVRATKQNISIIVDDTGIGISPDKLESIFDPFRQADDSIERKYGGTGLGLAIVKKLTTLMSGYISINSTEGEGTSVMISLPLKSYEYKKTKICFNYTGQNTHISNWFSSCEEKDKCIKIIDSIDELKSKDDRDSYILINDKRLGMGFNEKYGIWEISTEPFYPDLFYKCKEKIGTKNRGFTSGGVNNLAGLKVLIAEDNPINQYMLSEQMDLLGINAVIVSDGLEAKKELQVNGENYDMLITDVHMPKMDGISLVRWVRENLSSFKYKPIVGCTAEHSKSLRRKMLDFDDIILKPFEVKRLFEVISSNKAKYKTSSGKNQKISSYMSTLSDDKRKRLVQVFRETMTNDLYLLKSAVDEEIIRKIAHKIKGGANSIGEFEVGDAAGQLESQCLESRNIEEILEGKKVLIEVLSNKLERSWK